MQALSGLIASGLLLVAMNAESNWRYVAAIGALLVAWVAGSASNG